MKDRIIELILTGERENILLAFELNQGLQLFPHLARFTGKYPHSERPAYSWMSFEGFNRKFRSVLNRDEFYCIEWNTLAKIIQKLVKFLHGGSPYVRHDDIPKPRQIRLNAGLTIPEFLECTGHSIISYQDDLPF